MRTLLAVLLVFAVLTASAQAGQPKPPNVVFILVDDMGYADIGCMGSKEIKTPHIDRLAKEGMLFKNFYAAAPICTPTRAAFVTGRYPQRVGLEGALGYKAQQFRWQDGKWVPEPDMYYPGLPADQSIIAHLLSQFGYRCGVIGKWHLGFRPEFNPIRHGFHSYFGVLTGHADFYTYKYVDGTLTLRENEKPGQAKGYLTDLINQKAVDFIEDNAKKPFMLYVPHLAVHFPFHVPDRLPPPLTMENLTAGSRQDYVAMLERIDQGVGMILDKLEKKGLADNTLVIFSSDNGGYKLSDNGPLFHQKGTLWEGGVRVPCLMRWPAVLPKGKTTEQMGITMDLTATILAAAGAKVPKDKKLDGIDLMPILTGKKKEQQRSFFWRIDRPNFKQKAARHGKWKYLLDGNIEFLFDLDADIGERKNLFYQQPALVEDLRQRLAAWEADVDSVRPPMLVK